MRSVNFQHILHRIATTIIKIGSCTPAFVQCRNIHRQSLVRARCPAYLILFLIRIVLSGMAARTVFLKNLLSLLCLTGKFTVHKVWAWQRFQGFQIFIDGFVYFVFTFHKQNILHTRTYRYFGILTDTGRHTGRSLMRKQKCLGILRVTHTVIQQVPVKSVHAGVIRMTGSTALPVLETNSSVMEIHITLSDFRESQRSTQNLLLQILAVQIHRHQFRSIIVGSENLISGSNNRTGAFPLCRDKVADTI